MITIDGFVNTAIIFADEIDSGSTGLIKALCNSPVSEGSKIRIMPDVHAGKGCVIGTTMTITDKIAPGFVGVDIGCGITAVRFKPSKKFNLEKLDKFIHEKIPVGPKVRKDPHLLADELLLDNLHCAKHVQMEKARRSIGTLGGGNHYIEIGKDSEGAHYLFIHSGSRGLGAEIAQWYQDTAYAQSPDGTPYELAYLTGDWKDYYLHDLQIATHFAATNRMAIINDIVHEMKLDIESITTTVHNYVDQEFMVLRKGAISAKAYEEVFIPLNMRDGCLRCVGLGNLHWNCSAPHGAGRLMSRAEARNLLTLTQYKKEMEGIYSSTINRHTIDESPMAYKSMDAILDQIEKTVTVLDRIKPIYNFKSTK